MDRLRLLTELSRALNRSIVLLDVPRERTNATEGIPFRLDMTRAEALARTLGYPRPPVRFYAAADVGYAELAYEDGTVCYAWRLDRWHGAPEPEYLDWRNHTLIPVLRRWKTVVDDEASSMPPPPPPPSGTPANPVGEQWSRPMSKTDMRVLLGNMGVRAFGTLAKGKLRPGGNRRTFHIRLDLLDPWSRKRLQ